MDDRKALNKTEIVEVSTWRSRKVELSISGARAEAMRLARYAIDLEEQIQSNE